MSVMLMPKKKTGQPDHATGLNQIMTRQIVTRQIMTRFRADHLLFAELKGFGLFGAHTARNRSNCAN